MGDVFYPLMVIPQPRKKKHKPRSGRPHVQFNWKEFENLCGIQCTEIEIAAWFRCSVDTLQRAVKCEYHKTFADVYEEKKGLGRISVRRMQFQQAIKGNPTMLVWLGKQLLDQKDRIEGPIGRHDVTIRVVYGEKGNSEDRPELETRGFGDKNPFARPIRQAEVGDSKPGEA
jgi:hypothetical protein